MVSRAPPSRTDEEKKVLTNCVHVADRMSLTRAGRCTVSFAKDVSGLAQRVWQRGRSKT